MEKNLQLTTNRLTLKELDESDAGKVLEYFQRNADFLRKWEPIRDAEFYTLDFQAQQLRSERQKVAEGKMFKVWMFAKEDTACERVLGSIALNEIVRGCFHSCFLGYRLDGSEVNKGLMTEGVQQVIDFAFNSLRLHRIEANIIPHNKASLRVVNKLGFYHEGLAKKYLFINGRWEDHIHMVLRNEAME
ncbi:MAG TPA: GNAT family N-acetyltransferase [Desulfobacteria bacterium]|nr:GNAT family N-acetyltransferase [Desulfobacteria bacterium]